METFNIICSILSILGFIISIYQSIKAKSIAIQVRDSVVSIQERKQLSIIDEILNNAHSVENQLFSHRGQSISNCGKNLNSIKVSIEKFLSLLNEKMPSLNANDCLSLNESFLKINNSVVVIDNPNEFKKAIETILSETRRIINILAQVKETLEYKI